jgi:hypothetical protein
MVVMTGAEASLEELNRLADRHRCGECGDFLVVDNPTGERLELHCASHPEHTTMKKLAGSFGRGVKDMVDTKSLQQYTPEKMLERVNKAKFPKDLTEVERKVIVQLAIDYGLDPLFGEVMVFQGKPYVTIDARRRKAQETGMYDGIKTRPATAKERQAWKIPKDDYFFHADVFKKDSTHPYEGWGRVRAEETKPGSKTSEEAIFKPIQNNPQQMAEKRAEAQALRKAFHLPLPSAEDITPGGVIVEGDYEVIPHTDKTRASGDSPHPKSACTAKTARTQRTTQDENERGESAQRQPDNAAGTGGDKKSPAAPSEADEHPAFSSNNKATAEISSEAPLAERLDWDWLHEVEKELKWTDATTSSFIVSLFPKRTTPIKDTGDLKLVINQLTANELSHFCKTIAGKSGNKPRLL